MPKLPLNFVIDKEHGRVIIYDAAGDDIFLIPVAAATEAYISQEAQKFIDGITPRIQAENSCESL